MNRESLNLQKQQMTLKPEKTSGRNKVTLFIVITLNLEFKYTWRKKKHPLFHWKYIDAARSTHTDLDVARTSVLMIIGMSTRTEVFQIRGQDSRNSLNWKRSTQRGTCGPGGDWQKFRRLPDQITCGQKYGLKLGKPHKREKSKNGQVKNQARQFSKIERRLLHWSGRQRIQRNFWACEEKVGSAYGRGYALQKEDETCVQLAGNCSKDQFIHRGSKHKVCLYSGISWINKTTTGTISTQKVTKTTLQAKETTQWTTTI